MRYRYFDDLRDALPESLPWQIRELILGNVIVGNFTDTEAIKLANIIDKKLSTLS